MEIRLEMHSPYIAIVTIDNQTRRNALTRAMLADLAELWDRLDASDCRAVVLTGAGTRAFSSCLLYTSPSPPDLSTARIPSSA